jgi:hypothetical protein
MTRDEEREWRKQQHERRQRFRDAVNTVYAFAHMVIYVTEPPEREVACPNCHADMVEALQAARANGYPECAGAITFCLHCAAPLIFNHDLTLRELTEADINGLPRALILELAAHKMKLVQYLEEQA